MGPPRGAREPSCRRRAPPRRRPALGRADGKDQGGPRGAGAQPGPDWQVHSAPHATGRGKLLPDHHGAPRCVRVRGCRLDAAPARASVGTPQTGHRVCAGRPRAHRGPAPTCAGESCPAPEWAVYTMANAATYGVVSALRAESGVRVQEVGLRRACWGVHGHARSAAQAHVRQLQGSCGAAHLCLGAWHGRAGWGGREADPRINTPGMPILPNNPSCGLEASSATKTSRVTRNGRTDRRPRPTNSCRLYAKFSAAR